MGLFKFDSYIQSTKMMRKKKTYMINHIPIKQVRLKENNVLIKYLQNWVDKKMLKNSMKKKVIVYQRTKVQKMGSPKNEGFKKTNILYKVKTLNHIIIYNVLFNLVNNYHFCSNYYMKDNV
jgi:hypothetical protein